MNDEQPIDDWQAFADSDGFRTAQSAHRPTPGFCSIAADRPRRHHGGGAWCVFRPTGASDEAFAAELDTLGVPSQFHEAIVVGSARRTVRLRRRGVPHCGVRASCRTGHRAPRTFKSSALGGITPDFEVGQTDRFSPIARPRASVLDNVPTECEFDPTQECRTADQSRSKAKRPRPSTFPETWMPRSCSPVIPSTSPWSTPEPRSCSWTPSGPRCRPNTSSPTSSDAGVLLWVALLFAAAVVVLGTVAWCVRPGRPRHQRHHPPPLRPSGDPRRDGVPVWVALFGALAIAVSALYIAHGFGPEDHRGAARHGRERYSSRRSCRRSSSASPTSPDSPVRRAHSSRSSRAVDVRGLVLAGDRARCGGRPRRRHHHPGVGGVGAPRGRPAHSTPFS